MPLQTFGLKPGVIRVAGPRRGRTLPRMDLDRYSRQVLLPGLGREGQERIARSTVLVLGCGALGGAGATYLARAGVGRLILVDRDCLELSNLQRQPLYDEKDLSANLPKALAAQRRLGAMNSEIQIEALVSDAHAGNIEELLRGVTVVLDGTDNFDTRYLLNDACVKLGVPWIYGGAVGTRGMSVAFVPGRTPCLRCLFESPPPPGAAPTCETEGILGPLPGFIGCYQAAEALKVCAGRLEALNPRMLSVDLWTGHLATVDVGPAPAKDCPCCGARRFEFLAGGAAGRTAVLCGRAAVQISPGREGALDLAALAERLSGAPGVSLVGASRFLLTIRVAGGEDKQLELAVFPDGRALVKGTRDPAVARAVYAKYLG